MHPIAPVRSGEVAMVMGQSLGGSIRSHWALVEVDSNPFSAADGDYNRVRFGGYCTTAPTSWLLPIRNPDARHVGAKFKSGSGGGSV